MQTNRPFAHELSSFVVKPKYIVSLIANTKTYGLFQVGLFLLKAQPKLCICKTWNIYVRNIDLICINLKS